MITLYFKGIPLIEEDYYTISEEFQITYDLVAEAVKQIQSKGEPLYAQYMGVARERIRKMAKHISTTQEIMQEQEPEEVDNAQDEPETALESIEPAAKTELQEVVGNAAVSLIRAMADTNDGSFIISEDGCCVVNPEKPPEISHAYQVVENVLKLRELAPAVDDKSAWMLGSIVASLEEFFGEEFSISQICAIESAAYNTVAQKVGVYKAFKDKRYDLSYSHHQEVHYAKIPDSAKKTILSKAESYELSTKNVRSLCSIVKKMDDDQTIKNIRSKEQAMSLIDAYKDSKTTYYIIKTTGVSKKNGLIGDIPTGDVVIDVKSNKAYIQGQAIDIEKL